jgi:hypothetical protein
MVKKILLVLGIFVVLFAGVNTAAALNSSIFDAISGLPLSDQIFFVAKEVDRLKLKDELRDACNKSESFFVGGYFNFENYNFNSVEQAQEIVSNGLIGEAVRLKEFNKRVEDYNKAKADCDSLTEEFNQKYGE